MRFEIFEVRDNNDPTGSGRVKVRSYNNDDPDEQKTTDDGLRWAHPLYPISNLPNGGIGSRFSAPMVGTRLLCIYLPEDVSCQSPIYIGGLARSESAGVKGIQQSDPNNGGKQPSGQLSPEIPGNVQKA
jgi:predicted protein tyrosine phosphatase